MQTRNEPRDKEWKEILAYAYRNFPSITVNPMGCSTQLADGHDFG